MGLSVVLRSVNNAADAAASSGLEDVVRVATISRVELKPYRKLYVPAELQTVYRNGANRIQLRRRESTSGAHRVFRAPEIRLLLLGKPAAHPARQLHTTGVMFRPICFGKDFSFEALWELQRIARRSLSDPHYTALHSLSQSASQSIGEAERDATDREREALHS
ncbi:hypothetical protein JOB18_036398 [Solea senegalensis]|uniref:Uncharacterized protein n=1 Tax=Solea senegalensis TaxID=28829 RepID=A0AAV6QZ75_SOLSE|nr:hypothetical protein JOB18_036398 [Solea senegalensis]